MKIKRPKAVGWRVGYQCQNCNDIFCEHGNFCPTCGEFAKDKKVIVRCFRDYTWWKFWTWNNFSYEVKD